MAESAPPLPPMADLTVPLAKGAAVIAAGQLGAALRPGGIVVVYDQIRTERPEPFHAAFSLLMFNQNGTRTYGFDELAGWLDEAGFDKPQRRDLPPGPSSVVTAVRTA